MWNPLEKVLPNLPKLSISSLVVYKGNKNEYRCSQAHGIVNAKYTTTFPLNMDTVCVRRNIGALDIPSSSTRFETHHFHTLYNIPTEE